MNDIVSILADLNSDSAKKRERAIKNLTPAVLQAPQVIDALQKIVSSDSVEYVREAARNALLSIGQIPAPSAAPVQLAQEGAGKPAMFAIGCVALVAICVFVAVVTIVILAILGPQIGTVFSRVTNGLANP